MNASEFRPSPRISKLRLRSIGPFDDTEIEIPPVTGPGELVLFEGPNGSGKTTILETIALAIGLPPYSPNINREAIWENQAEAGAFDSQIQALSDRRVWAGNYPATLPPMGKAMRRFRSDGTFSVQLEEQSGSFDVLISAGGDVTCGGSSERIPKLLHAAYKNASGEDNRPEWAAFAFQGHQRTPITTAKSPADLDRPALRGALSFGRFGGGHLDLGVHALNLNYKRTQAIAATMDPDISPQEREKHMEQANTFARELKYLTQVLSDISMCNIEIKFIGDRVSPTFFVNGEALAFDLLGEGIRSTLAWLSDLLVRIQRVPWANPGSYAQPFWLLLDEIDQSLHPKLQVHVLPALMKMFPNARIYASTHSPFVVASAGVGHVVKLTTGEKSTVVARPQVLPLSPGQSVQCLTSLPMRSRQI